MQTNLTNPMQRKNSSKKALPFCTNALASRYSARKENIFHHVFIFFRIFCLKTVWNGHFGQLIDWLCGKTLWTVSDRVGSDRTGCTVLVAVCSSLTCELKDSIQFMVRLHALDGGEKTKKSPEKNDLLKRETHLVLIIVRCSPLHALQSALHQSHHDVSIFLRLKNHSKKICKKKNKKFWTNLNKYVE